MPLEEIYQDTHRGLLQAGDTWTGQPYGLFDGAGIELVDAMALCELARVTTAPLAAAHHGGQLLHDVLQSY